MASDSGKDSPPLSTESSSWTGSAVQDFNSLAHRIAHKLHLDHPEADTRDSMGARNTPPRTPTTPTTPSSEDMSRPRAVSLGSMPMPEIVMPLPENLVDGTTPPTTPKKSSQLATSPPTNADSMKKPAVPPGYTFQMKQQMPMPNNAQQKKTSGGDAAQQQPQPRHKFEFAKVDKKEDEMLSLDDEGASDFSSWQVPRIFSIGGN